MTAQPLAVVYPNPVDPAVLTVHRVCRCGTLAARLALLFIYVFLTSVLQSCCACLRGSSCSSEAAQVSHVTSLAGKHVALNINGDEVTLYEASGDATAAVQQGSTRKEQPKVCGCMCARCRVAQLACAKSCVSMPSAVQGCVLVPCARFSVKSYEAYRQCAQKHGANGYTRTVLNPSCRPRLCCSLPCRYCLGIKTMLLIHVHVLHKRPAFRVQLVQKRHKQSALGPTAAHTLC